MTATATTRMTTATATTRVTSSLELEQPTNIMFVFRTTVDGIKVDDDVDADVNVFSDVGDQSKFSHLLHCFRIFLLIYHSVTWSTILTTTGISRQRHFEEIDACD